MEGVRGAGDVAVVAVPAAAAVAAATASLPPDEGGRGGAVAAAAAGQMLLPQPQRPQPQPLGPKAFWCRRQNLNIILGGGNFPPSSFFLAFRCEVPLQHPLPLRSPFCGGETKGKLRRIALTPFSPFFHKSVLSQVANAQKRGKKRIHYLQCPISAFDNFPPSQYYFSPPPLSLLFTPCAASNTRPKRQKRGFDTCSFANFGKKGGRAREDGRVQLQQRKSLLESLQPSLLASYSTVCSSIVVVQARPPFRKGGGGGERRMCAKILQQSPSLPPPFPQANCCCCCCCCIVSENLKSRLLATTTTTLLSPFPSFPLLHFATKRTRGIFATGLEKERRSRAAAAAAASWSVFSCCTYVDRIRT